MGFWICCWEAVLLCAWPQPFPEGHARVAVFIGHSSPALLVLHHVAADVHRPFASAGGGVEAEAVCTLTSYVGAAPCLCPSTQAARLSLRWCWRCQSGSCWLDILIICYVGAPPCLCRFAQAACLSLRWCWRCPSGSAGWTSLTCHGYDVAPPCFCRFERHITQAARLSLKWCWRRCPSGSCWWTC